MNTDTNHYRVNQLHREDVQRAVACRINCSRPAARRPAYTVALLIL